MKYLAILLLFVSCQEQTMEISNMVDIDSLPDCPKKVYKNLDKFFKLDGDDGSILYIINRADYKEFNEHYMCLDRRNKNDIR